MNLKGLIVWCKTQKNLKTLRENVAKEQDPTRRRGMEGDINMCLCFLGEIEKRAQLVLDHTKKAEKYYADIEEYLAGLRKRGVIYNVPDNTPSPVTLPGSEKEPYGKTGTSNANSQKTN